MEYLAHIKYENGVDGAAEKQTVKRHCVNTANYASEALANVGLKTTAYLAGILHDMGKYSNKFQDYLLGNVHYEKGSVIHTFQAVRYLLENYHEEEETAYAAEIVAYAAGAHHGLFDCINSDHNSGWEHRKNKENTDYEEVVKNYFSNCITQKRVKALLEKSAREIEKKNAKFLSYLENNETDEETEEKKCSFTTGALARLVLSAVIDGDRRDTAKFMECKNFNNVGANWECVLAYMEEKISKFPADTAINKARKEISDRCKKFAKRKPGIYKLNIPTGGGKTLSSLRYALEHARIYNKKRIILVSPLLSILEQNAKVYKDYIGNKAITDRIVLEHYSNIIQTGKTKEELDARELHTETWDSPVIITTFVQLLMTLFSHKTTSIRRFNALADSVIVIDEVQTLPPKMTSMFNSMIEFLSTFCNTTIILCSATQPCFEETDTPLAKKPVDIIPYNKKLWKPFERTEIKPLRKENGMNYSSVEELAEWVKTEMNNTQSLLVVCNKKDEASYFANNIKSDEWNTYHISASMCPQHRKDVLNKIKKDLNNNVKVLCVSTQVIEAGVDISFAEVVRLSAGMDSVVQSAGRCNRNGESKKLRPVWVAHIENENLSRLHEIRMGKNATQETIHKYDTTPEVFNKNLCDDSAIEYYYKRFYSNMAVNEQDYHCSAVDATLFDLLCENEAFRTGADEKTADYVLVGAYKTAGENFSVFNNNTVDVIVPYGEGSEIIANLCSERALQNEKYRYYLIKKAANYSISLYSYQVEALLESGDMFGVCVTEDGESAFALTKQVYDEIIGLNMAGANTVA